MDVLHNRLALFQERIKGHSASALHDHFFNEVLECGGRFITPASGRTANFLIELHGVTAIGKTEAATIENWRVAAQAECA